MKTRSLYVNGSAAFVHFAQLHINYSMSC